MIILTTPNYPNKEIKEVKGIVTGSTIQCKNIGEGIETAIKNLVCGELVSYKEMLDDARKISLERMVEEAEDIGANCIIGFRLISSTVTAGAVEIVAYGTAVIV